MRLDIIPFVFERKNFLFALGVLLLSGCARPTSLPRKAPAVRAGELPVITVIAGGRESYWLQAKAGAVAAGKKLGAKIVWKVPVGNDLVASQKKLMEDATQDSHGIVLAPADSTKLMQPVGDAALAGLAVVVFDRDVYTLQNKLSYVHNDDEATGVLAAQKLEGKSGSNQLIGALNEVSAPEVQQRILSFEQRHRTDGATRTDRYTFEDEKALLDSDGVFAPDEASSLRVLKAPFSNYHFVAVGFGADEALQQAVKKGKIAALISPDYYQMAFQSVKAIMDYRALKYPPREIKIAPRVVKK